jgi:hypothetical protein
MAKSLFGKSDAGGLGGQMVGCKDADPRHIPEYVEDRGSRRRPFAAPRRSRRSCQTGSKLDCGFYFMEIQVCIYRVPKVKHIKEDKIENQ